MSFSEIDQIFETYRQKGHRRYGENVTELQHALQAATLAQRQGEPDEIVLACLLHDYGHLLHDLGEQLAEQHVDSRHEQLGAQMLADLFPAKIVEPIRMHADAKRYLCWQNSSYYAGLSSASQRSLDLQGGPMSDDEARQFELHPHFDAAIRLRRYDDRAKVPDMRTPELDSYRSLAVRLVSG